MNDTLRTTENSKSIKKITFSDTVQRFPPDSDRIEDRYNRWKPVNQYPNDESFKQSLNSHHMKRNTSAPKYEAAPLNPARVSLRYDNNSISIVSICIVCLPQFIN